MANERKTENIVRNELRRLGYYEEDNDISVEEQKSNIETVKRLLKSASKSGQGGKGAPEFIISAPSSPDFLLVIECKASTKDHVSEEVEYLLEGMPLDETPEQMAKRLQRFAVDGILHYAHKLSKEYNVLAVAVSGETKSSVRVSSYLIAKGASTFKQLCTKEDQPVEELIPWSDYIEHATYDPTVQRMRFDELMAFSRDLHDFMRDHAKLTEGEKPLIVSGRGHFRTHKPSQV